jgi:hypothetical protein
MEPTTVKLKTETEEGPIKVLIDDDLVLTLDLKASPGMFHVVIPHEYRMKEVPHMSPELGEGIHYAVMIDESHIMLKQLEMAMKDKVRAQSDQQQRVIMAIEQQKIKEESKGAIPPLLEVWDDKKGIWKPELWLYLKVGMRCRQRHTLSGELMRYEKSGQVDWICKDVPQCTDGVWETEAEIGSFPDYKNRVVSSEELE